MKRIGHYIVERDGGRWIVASGHDWSVISTHGSFWDAVRAAREYGWHEKRPPVPSTGGSEEPKSKWRWVI